MEWTYISDITSRQPYIHTWWWLEMPQAYTILQSCKAISPWFLIHLVRQLWEQIKANLAAPATMFAFLATAREMHSKASCGTKSESASVREEVRKILKTQRKESIREVVFSCSFEGYKRRNWNNINQQIRLACSLTSNQCVQTYVRR